MTQYYDFRFGEDNAGWYEITTDEDTITMNATFMMEGEVYENPFTIKLEGDRVTHYRIADGDWIELPEDEDVYPTSAYPLLVPQVEDQLTYRVFHEGKQAITGAVTLAREGDMILEISSEGTVGRKFKMADGQIVWIDWNGATSSIKDSLEDAQAGSDFAKQ